MNRLNDHVIDHNLGEFLAIPPTGGDLSAKMPVGGVVALAVELAYQSKHAYRSVLTADEREPFMCFRFCLERTVVVPV